MSNTTPLFARIDTELKTNAEAILTSQGLTPTSFISMMYSQIVESGEVSVFLHIPRKPIALGSLSKEEFEAEIMKGIRDVEEGRVLTSKEANDLLEREFGFNKK